MDSSITNAKAERIPHGFTLVEMMVVLAIIGTITSIALFGQQNFNRSLLLTDTAYTVAMSARQAQTLGLSSRRYVGGGQDITNAGYGLNLNSVTPAQYILFADTRSVAPAPLASCPIGVANTPEAKVGDCKYTGTGALVDGVVQTYTFNRGFTIANLCGTQSGTALNLCVATGGLSAIDITFVRGNSETIFTGRTPAGGYVALDNAKVYIQSADGTAQRGVCFTRAGQISVSQGTCP